MRKTITLIKVNNQIRPPSIFRTTFHDQSATTHRVTSKARLSAC